MPATETSKTTVVAAAVQNYHSSNGSFTAATTFYKMLLTDWASTPVPSFDEIDDEIDGSYFSTSPSERLGVSTPVSGSGRMRSDTQIWALRGAGFAVTSTPDSPVAGADKHVLVPVAGDDTFPWLTFLVHMGSGSNILKRIVNDVRLSSVTLSGERNAIARWEIAGTGGHEEVAIGTESVTADASPVLRTVEGSFVVTKDGGGNIAGTARMFSANIANEFTAGDDNFIIGAHEMDWQTWLQQTCTGSVDTVFNKATWESIFYGGNTAAGSGYDFAAVTGALDVTVQSSSMVTGTTPFSMRVEIPHLTIMAPEDVRNSGRSELRMVLPFRAYQSGADPLVRVTFINNITAY